jgi:hypothetical protein
LSSLSLKKINRIVATDYGAFLPFDISPAAFSSNIVLLAPSRNVTVSANVELWYSI